MVEGFYSLCRSLHHSPLSDIDFESLLFSIVLNQSVWNFACRRGLLIYLIVLELFYSVQGSYCPIILPPHSAPMCFGSGRAAAPYSFLRPLAWHRAVKLPRRVRNGLWTASDRYIHCSIVRSVHFSWCSLLYLAGPYGSRSCEEPRKTAAAASENGLQKLKDSLNVCT